MDLHPDLTDLLSALAASSADYLIIGGWDLLRRIPGVEFREAFARRVVVDWSGTRVSVIGRDDLIAAKRAAKASALLRILDADLASRFPDSQSVNEALRALLTLESTLPKKRPRGRRAA